ncbi:SH3 domain-containing protein [Drancourtella massiliensis]|nr:SH3 domain-containing protein [Drancourtella massiliensis]RHV36722.1 glycosyl hydrolase family 18 [Ruminococcus sp. OM05-10BH]HIV93994.1 SH3 domain-containing protein [Candidatus Sellimonas avistercoris]
MDMDERRGKRRPDGRPARKRQRPVQQQDPRRRNQESRRQKELEMRRQIRRRKKRRKRILILLLLLLIAVIAAGIVLWIRYGPSREEADKNEYFGITDTSQVGLAIDNQIPDVKSMKEGSEVYLDFDSVHDYVNQRFYWDSNENRLLYTLPDRTLSIPAGATEFESEDGTQTRDYEIVKVENDTVYLALDFVKEYTDMSLDVYENPDRAVIVTNKEENHARVSKDTEVRILGGVKSPILTEISKSDDVVVIEEAGSWMKVRTVDGYIGYVKSNTLEKAEKQTRKSEYEEPEYTNIQKDYKINLAWHQVTSQAANENVASVIAGTTGLTTISPTWFTIQDTNGNITSLASSAYVDAAHQAGLEVWGLVDNFTNQVDTLAVLSNTQSRANMISQLITEAQNSGLDGINVDFEQITEEMSDHYIQFIRELSVECRKNQIVLSVDNYVPGFTSHYNREEQGIVADYVIIMGYDEHFAGSEEAGSVASIDFVREGITETLKEVPKEKVINGLPFFTRLWIESSSGLTSQAIGMQEAETAVANAGVTASWDEETQQNYAEWTADGNTYKIWLEDEQSLEAKLKVMQEYDLAGAAAWKLGFEKSGIWELISRYVNG